MKVSGLCIELASGTMLVAGGQGVGTMCSHLILFHSQKCLQVIGLGTGSKYFSCLLGGGRP